MDIPIHINTLSLGQCRMGSNLAMGIYLSLFDAGTIQFEMGGWGLAILCIMFLWLLGASLDILSVLLAHTVEAVGH